MKTFTAVLDPDEKRDFGVDWSAQVGTGEIVDSAWSVTSGTVEIVNDVFTATTTTVRLTGGAVGENAELLNHVTLADGQEYDQTVKLKVRAR